MSKDRQIKKALDAELEPTTPFEEFCRVQGIEPTSTKNRRRTRQVLIPVVSVLCAVMIALGIALPLTLRSKSSGGGTTPVKYYGVSDEIKQTPTTADEIRKDGVVTLYDKAYEIREPSASKALSDDGKDVFLYYAVREVYFGDGMKDATFVYIANYFIASDAYIYDYGHEYDESDRTYTCGGFTFEYRIGNGVKGAVAHVRFRDGKVTQYIELTGHPKFTAIDETSVEFFLQKAYGDK